MGNTDEFAEGAHALTARRHKQLHLRVASGYPVYGGVGAYGSPLGAVTGVQTGQTQTDTGTGTGTDAMSSDQFGGMSTGSDASAGDSGGSGGAPAGGGM